MRPAIAAMLVALSLASCGDNTTTEVKKQATPAPEASARTPSPAGAKVMILEPADGATVKNPVTVKFGVEGMKVVPAGTDEPDSGHHHLLIDTTDTDENSPIPADATHVHYGKGQTEGQ